MTSESLEKSFTGDTGKETTLQVVQETQIGGGLFGDVFDTVVEIGKHKKRFIVKKYGKLDQNTAQEDTRRAFQNYSLAKKAGLKVFPTFRIGNDEKSLLMTNGFLDDKICIGSNQYRGSLVYLKQPLIESIQEVDKFLIACFAQGLKATRSGLFFNVDSYFFILDKNIKPTKIDFVLGDLDNLDKKLPSKYIGLANMSQIRTMLIEFCNQNTNPEFRKKFLTKIEYQYKKAVNNVNNSELID